MSKIEPADGHQAEEGRYVICNGYSSAVVSSIWETSDVAMFARLEELAMTRADPGAILDNRRRQDG